MRWIWAAVAATAPLLASPVAASAPLNATASTAAQRPDHVVVVVMENKRYDAVIGHRRTPYITALARRGANFTAAYGETHPSQPNYLALFSGSTQGVTDNACIRHPFDAPNLGRQLLDAGLTFTGYAEALPSTGFTGCSAGTYVRRHNPWVDFADVPADLNRPLRDLPSRWGQLPTVAFVVPDLCHDMHNCPKADADRWMRQTLGSYADWAESHNSLLILTFDEDNGTDGNHIPTLVLGAGVRPGDRTQRVDHYAVLRTIEDAYGLPPLGAAAQATPLPLS
ncbi:alkaline phosphatase family protein [Dactylosporangium vinaceum]|uniref:Alkaline phosphatase family protein n=1 Tax=Dactylosporangium vinaceum TaxID=53362 RepID=A0ABV5M2D8_9ACTN|nr:alkaline phosphatase family protein [Dactylosporangium vinaceum]